jgi:hypothetical protein
MSGLVPPRLLYAFMACTGTTLHLRLSQAEGNRKYYAKADTAH